MKLRRMVPTRRWVVNYGALLWSLVLAFVLTVGIYAWHDHVVEGNANALLKRADQQEAEKQWSAAADTLKRFLALNPHHGPARMRLAQDFDRVASSPAQKYKALQLFAAAVAIAPNEAEPRRRHLALTFEMGDSVAALEHANSLLKNAPSDAVGLKYRALALYAQWELKKEKSLINVKQAFESANHADPGDDTIAARLARLYRLELKHPSADERAKLADAVMDKLVETGHDKVAALVARNAYRSEFDLPGGEADLKWALELADERGKELHDPAVFLAAGLAGQEKGDAKTAIQYFKQAVDVAPDKPRGYLLLSQVYRGEGDLSAAVRLLNHGLEHIGDNRLPLQAQLTSLRIELDEFVEARTLLDTMQSQAALLFGGEQTEWLAMIQSLRAELLLRQKDYLTAIPVLKRVLMLRQGGAAYEQKTATDARTQMQLGICYATLGQWDQAALAYQAAADLQPQQAALRLAAAEAWDNAGWLDEAARQYQDALALDSVPPRAVEAVASALYRQQMRLPRSKRDWSAVRQAFNYAQGSLHDSASLQLLRAEYELAKGEFDLANGMLESVEEKIVEAPGLTVRLARLYERLGRHDDADRIAEKLTSEQAALPGTLLKCELLLRRNRGDDAEKLLAAALSMLSPAERNIARYRLALIYLYRGKREEGRQELVTVSQSAVDDVRPLELLAEMALETGDWNEAQKQEMLLQELEKIDGQSGWQFYRAQRLIGEALQQVDPAKRDPLIVEARSLGQQLERVRPYWAPTYLLKGRLAQLGTKPDDEAAVEAYFEALRLGERRVQLYQELISLLFRCHRISEAAALIDRLREADDVPQELVSLAVAADVSQGNLGRAVRLAAAEVHRNPNDAMSHLRYGQLLALGMPTEAPARQRQVDEAEAELKRAQELAPRDSRIWSALLAFYHTTGQVERSRETLAQVAGDDFLGDKDKAFFLAQGYALLGDDKQARKLYLEAVDANPDRVGVLVQAGDFFFRSEPERAEKYLRHAVKLEPGEPTAVRKLAALLALRSSSEQEMNEVWQLLDANSSQGMPDVADQRLRAVLLLRRGGSRSRKQAQQVLESLVVSRSIAPLDRLLLSRLYEAQGEIEKAREQLESLVQQGQPDPAHLAAYADHLLRNAGKGRTSSPTRLPQILDQLASLEPEKKNFRTLSLRARWLQLIERGAEVPALVDQFLAQPLPTTDSARKAQRLLMVAGLYDTLGMQELAEDCYRQALDVSAAAYRPLATWLARHGRSPEAIELCQRAAASDKSAGPASALAAVFTAGSATARERAAAEPVFAEALSQHPEDRGLLFGLATWRLMQHQEDDAERLLRRFLQLEPRNVAAMNNLAMLLADDRGSAGEALELVERAITIAGAQPELFDTKGWVMLEQKRFSEAEANFQEALAMPPDSPRYRFHLALSYQRQGKNQDAQTMLQRALDDNLAAQLLSPKERDELHRLQSIGK
ncbi:MAG TPA: tetratricopeptide repeat protein [Pirellulales bacterium]|nr:tetratricopeptide repeat protein [Pirellulales bacterium]